MIGRLGPVMTVMVLVLTVVAYAFWSAPGSGTAAATTATLTAATIAAPSSATNSITVTFSQQATLQPSFAANSSIGYVVQRKLAGGSFAAVSSGGCSGTKAYGIASCADVPPATGTYSYRVVASFHSWTATSNETGPVAFLLDTTAATVQSIQRLDPSPTTAATVRWTVTFSEAVTGVGSGDFALARAGGLSGGSITGVTGTGATYTATSSTGTGDGTLGLNLVDDDSITDVAANALGGAGAGNGNLAGEIYTIDRTAPVLSTLSLRDTNANGKVDTVTATFNELLASSTDTAPWTLANVPSGGTLSNVSTTGFVATLTLTEGAGAMDTAVGAMTVALAASATGIRDPTGNQSSFAARAPSDGAAPVRTAMQMLDTNANGKVDRVTVTFSETLASSTLTSQWTLANVPSGGSLASVSTSGITATLTIAEGSGAADTAVGGFTVALAADASGIRDGAVNPSSFSAVAPADLAAPAKIALDMRDADADGKVDRVVATFSESLANSTATSPWMLTAVPSSGSLLSLSTSGSTATLELAEGTGAADTAVGSFKVALAVNAGGILDAAGNQSLFSASAPADGAAPVKTALEMFDIGTGAPVVANGRVDRVVATFSENLVGSTLTSPWTLTAAPSAGSLASVSTSGFVATLVLTEGTGTADTAVGSFTVALATDTNGIRDTTGNQSSFSVAAPADRAAPVKTALEMSDILPGTGVNANGKVDRVVATFSENLASSALTAPWTLTAVPSSGSLASVSTSGSVATLVLSEGAGGADTAVGSFKVALAATAGGILDAAGNQSSFGAVGPDDKAGPVPVGVTDQNAGGLLSEGRLQADDSLAATFSEPIAGGVAQTTTITESRGAAGNAFLAIAGFTNGALDMGSPLYALLTVTVTFDADAVLSVANTKLTVTAGSCTIGCLVGNLLPGSTGSGMDYRPAPALKDGAANPATGSFHTNFPLF